MGKRHEAIGIKQEIQLDWLQKAVNLLLAGLNTKSIRQELHVFLENRNSEFQAEKRGETSRSQLVNMIMKIWVSPDTELIPLRDCALDLLRKDPSIALAVHWSMVIAVYPFWFNVAHQTGRLLSLQEQVTQAQIIKRLKEQYGDRQTVSRYARYVIRSFVSWGALRDSDSKGCYEKTTSLCITEPNLSILMVESALFATPEGKGTLGLIMNNPAFFPFQLPAINGAIVSQNNERIDVVHFGLDDVMLIMK